MKTEEDTITISIKHLTNIFLTYQTEKQIKQFADTKDTSNLEWTGGIMDALEQEYQLESKLSEELLKHKKILKLKI